MPTSVKFIVNGMPSAVPLEPAKLLRMSPRTMPESVSAFWPFEPSLGVWACGLFGHHGAANNAAISADVDATA